MFLGIDCGTQSTKALIIDRDGKALGRGSAPHQIIERESGAREQHPAWWVEALKSAVRAAVQQAGSGKVAALGVSGQQHGLVVLDENKDVIRPAKLWNDTETAPENAELVRRFGGPAAWLERFGILPLTGYTVSKLLWLREKEPQNFARIRHILLPHEYLNYWLTGEIAAEWGDASGTGYFDVRSRKWIGEVLEAIDGGSGLLAAALPSLLGPEEIVGRVRPEIAAELGISPECIVSVGGGDNMMGAIGTANVQQGVVTMSLGTSSTVYSFRDQPARDADPSVAPFCSSAGGWLPLVCTMNATNVVTRTLQLLGKTVADIDGALASTSPGADGLTFLPFLNGERTPDLPTARGTLLGISAINWSGDHLIRATLEGVTFGVVAGLALVLDGTVPDRIMLIGGGARSAGWRQLIADLTGSRIEVPTEEEAGCLGAAIQAIFAYGHRRREPEPLVEIAGRCVALDSGKRAAPDASKQAAYQAAFSLYRERLQHIHGVQSGYLAR